MQTKHISLIFLIILLHYCLIGCKSYLKTQEQNTPKIKNVTIQLIPIPIEDTYYIPIGPPFSEFISNNSIIARVTVDCKIRITNKSEWPFCFGMPYSWSGYDNLEFDLMLDDDTQVVIKRRSPSYLSDKKESITILPQDSWENVISFDTRLWDIPSSIQTKKILKIRPRFAFGAFKVNQKYYRFYDENKKCLSIYFNRTCRDGELIGDWVDNWNIEMFKKNRL